MSEQRTLHRVLEMMVMLSKPGGRTIQYMAEKFEVHERTIKRTIETIRDAGYYLYEERGRYYMDKEENARKAEFDVTQLLSFTREEIHRLKAMFENNIPRNHTYDYLLSKIFGAIGLHNSSIKVLENQNYRLVQTLREAIRQKKQIRIKTYEWSSANRSLPDVIMEPIDFAMDHTRIWCYYPQLKQNVLVRLPDMDDVFLTETPMKYAEQHRTGYIDIFGASGFEKYPVIIHLNSRARGYLKDEFAISSKEIKPVETVENVRIPQREKWFKFETEVCGYFHISRFCMGLPGDVEIITPELQEYIDMVQNKANKIEHKPSSINMRL